MQVSECMTREVEVVSPEDTIRDAAQMMMQIDAGILPVGRDDRLVGMITDRDIAVRAVAQGRSADAKVGDVMSPEVRYCYDDADTSEVLDNMGQLQLRRMPVIDREKRLVSIASIGDLAKTEEEESGEALGQIARASPVHSQ